MEVEVTEGAGAIGETSIGSEIRFCDDCLAFSQRWSWDGILVLASRG